MLVIPGLCERVPVVKSVLFIVFKELLLLIVIHPSVYSYNVLRHRVLLKLHKPVFQTCLMRHHDDWRSDYFQTYIKQARVDMYRARLAKNSLIIK